METASLNDLRWGWLQVLRHFVDNRLERGIAWGLWMQNVLDTSVRGVTTGAEENSPLFGIACHIVGGEVLLCTFDVRLPVAMVEIKLSEVPVSRHYPRCQNVMTVVSSAVEFSETTLILTHTKTNNTYTIHSNIGGGHQ